MAHNKGSSPDDGIDNDTAPYFESDNRDAELEVSEAFSVPCELNTAVPTIPQALM